MKTKSRDRLLMTAMPKPKKQAETKVVQLSETLFEHLMKLVMFGTEVEASKKWMKEVRDKCMRMHAYAADTTNKHLDPDWVFEQIFKDFAKTPVYLEDQCVNIVDYNDEYQGRFDPRQYGTKLYKACAKFFSTLSDQLTDKDYRFGSDEFYRELLEFIDSFDSWK